jgi:hypothetical protein
MADEIDDSNKNSPSSLKSDSDLENQHQQNQQNQQNQKLKPNEWTIEIEELINRWKDQTEKLSNVHQESGYITRIRYYRLAIPSIIVPFIMTFVSQNINDQIDQSNQSDNVQHIQNITYSLNLINGLAFMFTSILSAINLFFGYSKTSEEHFQVSARYSEISTRIDSELARIRKFRTPSDVFITEIKGKIESLNDISPNLPGNWC